LSEPFIGRALAALAASSCDAASADPALAGSIRGPQSQVASRFSEPRPFAYSGLIIFEGDTLLAALVTLMAVADATSTNANPELISIEVGLVRITPFRPGTQTAWAIPGRTSQSDPCAVLVPLATVAGGPASMVAGVAGGGILKSLCTSITDQGTATQTHLESDPNVYVRLASGRLTFRSYTVAKTRAHRFNFRVVVPAAAIPKAGLVVDVISDDGSADEESKEVIGTARLSFARLVAAANDGAPLELKDNGAEKIELNGFTCGADVALENPSPRRESGPCRRRG
jgi:hypothetical protein